MTNSVSTGSTNPLLDKLRVLDGITVKIPSGGLLYGDGVLHPDVIDGEVRVYPMTTRDDIALRSVDGLFGGTAIKQVFARCVPEVLDPSLLFMSDLDYLLVALRNVSYGSDMEIEYTHDCENAKSHMYNVQIEPLLKQTKYLDPLLVDSEYTVFTSSGQCVKLRPIRAIDMMDILQPPSEELNSEEIEMEILKLFVTQILSVDDITDREMISEWLLQIPAPDLKLIRAGVNNSTEWGVSYEQTIVCKDCKNPVQISTPLNPVTFFS